MQATPRNVVQFKSAAFNTTLVQPHFFNDFCFGEDLAQWLRPRLQALGYEVTPPGQEDWGWYLESTRDGVTHILNIGCIAEDAGPVWRIDVERCRSLPDRLFGRKREIVPGLAWALHNVLAAASEITEIGWYACDGRGQELGPSWEP